MNLIVNTDEYYLENGVTRKKSKLNEIQLLFIKKAYIS